MAEMDPSQFSLMSLEEELTCSICLSTFDCPVTIPCGHNFCQDCLLSTWKDSFSCPQCRAVFATKPELKKNTVLSTVVKTISLRSGKSEADLISEEISSEPKQDVILCDTCMEAEASYACLTCMAYYCEEHLRPHRENPKFSVHQLSETVGDLKERICMDHHKLKEFFCNQHDRPICSMCLQNDHKGCTFISPEEQKNLKESDLRDKLDLLDGKIEKTETVLFQVNDMQSRLKDAAAKKKAAFAASYQQMRDILSQEERNTQHDVDHELEIGQTKLRDFMKRLNENNETMRKARDDISSLLSQSQTLTFLQASFDLPRVVKFDPYPPRISLDSKKVMATQAFTVALNEHLTGIFQQPAEDRLAMIKPAECAGPVSRNTESVLEAEKADPPGEKGQSTSNSPVCPPIQSYFQAVPVPVYIGQHGGWNPSQYSQGRAPGFNKHPPFKSGQKTNKKGETSQQSFHKPDKKPPSAAGGNKPSAKGSDYTKKDTPRSHPSSGKSAGHHPHPKKDK